MQISLPAMFKQFRYSPLGADMATGNGDANPNKLSIKAAWGSKRIRVVALATILLLFVAIGVYFHDRITLPAYASSLSSPSSSSLPSPPSSSPPTTGAGHLVSSNLDILNEVAPSVDWSRFAYVQYVTNLPYLCNSVMLFAILDRLGCRSDRLMMYPQGWNPDTSEGQKENDESRLLRIARDKYKVKLQPIHVQSKAAGDRECNLLHPIRKANFRSDLGGKLYQTSCNESDPLRPRS